MCLSLKLMGFSHLVPNEEQDMVTARLDQAPILQHYLQWMKQSLTHHLGCMEQSCLLSQTELSKNLFGSFISITDGLFF